MTVTHRQILPSAFISALSAEHALHSAKDSGGPSARVLSMRYRAVVLAKKVGWNTTVAELAEELGTTTLYLSKCLTPEQRHSLKAGKRQHDSPIRGVSKPANNAIRKFSQSQARWLGLKITSETEEQ